MRSSRPCPQEHCATKTTASNGPARSFKPGAIAWPQNTAMVFRSCRSAKKTPSSARPHRWLFFGLRVRSPSESEIHISRFVSRCPDRRFRIGQKHLCAETFSFAANRLAAGRLTVADATNVKPEDRKPLVELARQYHCLPVAIVLNMPERICQDRNQVRTDRRLGNHVAYRQIQNLRRSLRGLEREGFRHVLILSSPEEAESIVLERVPLYNNKKTETGPFDIIGDIHGCYEELVTLLAQLGYTPDQTSETPSPSPAFLPPPGRRAVFLGDLVDRGPSTPAVLRLVMHMVAQGHAFCV